MSVADREVQEDLPQPVGPSTPPEGARASGRRRLTPGWMLLAVLVVAVASAVAAALALSSGGSSSRGAPGTALPQAQPVTEIPVDGRGAPVELSGTTLTDEPLDLADLRGRPVVVNVWGSWCAPCRTEAPILAATSAAYADRVSFVGVDVKDNRAAAIAFEQNYGITYPSIEDPDGRAVLALSQYVPASAVPVTLVLDDQGRVAARVLGAVREATLTALLDAVLAEAA